MCGIFGYVGTKRAEPILLEGLRALEYRGYDSAGLYIPGSGTRRAVGNVANLAERCGNAAGTAGIAHTRWATHGPPTEQNAHPHVSADGRIMLVHNGIIENYRELRKRLQAQGVSFTSDTDSEVLASLIATHFTNDLVHAVTAALAEVRGTYGIAVMAADDPETIVAARLGSPIVIGIGTDEHFIASDPSALLSHTRRVVYLDDGECAVIQRDAYHVIRNGIPHLKEPELIEWEAEAVQKHGFDHFMLKEIFEGPEVVKNTLRGRLIPKAGRAKLGGLEAVLPELLTIDRLTITACGTAYLAGYVGKYLLETYAGMPVDLELASEYRYHTHVPAGRSALLAVTQSGETADTLAAVRLAKERGLLTLGMVNVVGSTIARETDAGIYNHAGPEVAVASTKAFVSQLTAFALLTLLIGRERSMSDETGKEIAHALQTLPDTIEKILARAHEIETIAIAYAGYRDAMFIGRQSATPIAYEGALKLKEITYIHAEAYAGGELKHGSIAMLDEQFPVIALAPKDHVYEKMLGNIEEVRARNVPLFAIGTEGDAYLASLADHVFHIPEVHPAVQPIALAVPLHLFAYYVGKAKGFNVDRPRNLAKSVTVE
jgi:glucosamine--fructose-6-phosphate aminotransferase (isomerizing)